MPRSSNHHYVPRWYLRNFGEGTKPRPYVYDKHDGRIFRATPERIASEIGFYDFPDPTSGSEIEKAFNRLEGPSASIVKRLIERKTTNILSGEDRAILAYFLALQILRVKEMREQIRYLDQATRGMLIFEGTDPNSVKGYSPIRTEEELRLIGIHLLKMAPEFASLLINKDWFVSQAASGIHFYSSDNPVVLHNTINQNPHEGTLGLAVPGIEIYFPLNSTLCLAIYCPSLKEISRGPLKEALVTGTSCIATASNVTFVNSLQVISSTRFVFARKPRFDLAKKILDDHPNLRQGRKPQIN